ncbi:hypothetical protein L9F63_014099, partial [Diploptera punctata]
ITSEIWLQSPLACYAFQISVLGVVSSVERAHCQQFILGTKHLLGLTVLLVIPSILAVHVRLKLWLNKRGIALLGALAHAVRE